MEDKMYRPEVQGPKNPAPMPVKPGIVNKPKPQPPVGRPLPPVTNKPAFNKGPNNPAAARAEALKRVEAAAAARKKSGK